MKTKPNSLLLLSITLFFSCSGGLEIDTQFGKVLVSPTTGLTTIAGGGTTNFSLALAQKPKADVTIRLNSSAESLGYVDKKRLVFSAQNWSQKQIVTITGTDETISANIAQKYKIVFAPLESIDGNYSALQIPELAVLNYPAVAGFTLSATSGLTTTEAGGTATFTMRLNRQPMGNVTVNLSSSNILEGTILPASFIFTSANWNIVKTATITGIPDLKLDGNVDFNIVTTVALGSDSEYLLLNPTDFSVTNIDVDSGKFLFVTTASFMGTGGLTTMDIRCNAVDAARPTVGGTYQAVLGALDSAGNVVRSGGLLANQRYYRGVDSLYVGITNGLGQLQFPLTNSTLGGSGIYWTGLTASFGVSIDTCRNGAVDSWTGGPFNGTVGTGTVTSSAAVATGTGSCGAGTARLLCAQQ